jgi:hypothetical protein
MTVPRSEIEAALNAAVDAINYEDDPDHHPAVREFVVAAPTWLAQLLEENAVLRAGLALVNVMPVVANDERHGYDCKGCGAALGRAHADDCPWYLAMVELHEPTAGYPADPTPTTADVVTANLPYGPAPGADTNTP